MRRGSRGSTVQRPRIRRSAIPATGHRWYSIDGTGFTLDLTTGTVTIQLEEITSLNGLAPNTPILTSTQLATIGTNIATELAAVGAAVDAALETAIDGVTVTGTADLPVVGDLTIDTTLGALRAGSLDGFTGGVIDAVLETALLGALVDALDDLETALASVADVTDGVSALLEPALEDVVPGLVTLTANVQSDAGEVFSVTALRLEVLPAITGGLAVLDLSTAVVGPNDALPAAVSLTPDRGPETGGTVVVVTGTDLEDATDVTIGGITVPVTAVTETSLEFTTPPHAPDLVDVIVNTPDGPTAPLEFEYYDVMDITGVDPDNGPEAGGNPVTITGDCLADVTAVEFGPATVLAADFTTHTDTEIAFLAPAGVGVIDITIVSDPASDCGDGFIDDGYYYYPEEAADAISLAPTSGPETGGTTVTIAGSGFGGATGVDIGGNVVTDITVAPTGDTITFVTPGHPAAVVDVIVLDPDGDSDPLAFEYLPVAATALSLAPSQGPETGGTTVTITGSGFGGATGVTFDGIAGTDFVVVSDTSIRVVTPAHAPGVVDVIVLDPAGDSAPLDFEYIAVPAMAITGFETGLPIGIGVLALLGGAAMLVIQRRLGLG